MRVGHLQYTRPMPWDRTPNVTGIVRDAAMALNTFWTTTATYTAPSQKKAYIDSACVSWIATGADANATRVGLRIVAFVNATNIPLCVSQGSGVAAGNHGEAFVANCGMITAGQLVRVQEGNSANPGQLQGSAGAKVTEFDA